MKRKKFNRYILLHKDDSAKNVIKDIKKDLNLYTISSLELNASVRAKGVLTSGRAIYFKNLGITIVEHPEEERLNERLDRSSSLLHWELERTFYAVTEEEYFKRIQEKLKLLNREVEAWETFLNRKNRPTIEPYKSTWGLESLDIQSSKYSGKGVNVAILDTGFYRDHPDFSNRVIEGKSFIEGEVWEKDGSGHGTHCTGVATGYQTRDKRRYGIAYGANIIIGKVLADDGSGSTSTILDGLDWALEKKAHVVSMSLGSAVGIGEKPSPIFEHVGRKALEKRSLIIAASGNDSLRPTSLPKPVSSPANAESIMAIAALDQYLKVATFSNAGLNASDGGRIDLSAPGVDIFSTYSHGTLYKTMSGTSMATPHVAGVAALYFEAFPSLSAAEIWLKMEKNAEEIEAQRRRDIGAGMVKIYC